MAEAAALIRGARRPLIVAGGGVRHTEACAALADFAAATGIAVAETQAGKGSLRWDHPQCLGGIGHTGTRRRRTTAARAADVVSGSAPARRTSPPPPARSSRRAPGS